jgi:hypothetical protein
MKNIFNYRHSKLVNSLNTILINTDVEINTIVKIFEEYEKNNLRKIDKLNRENILNSKRVSGALRQTIFSHGPITKLLIGSATKRIIGGLLSNKTTKKTKFELFIQKLINLFKRKTK